MFLCDIGQTNFIVRTSIEIFEFFIQQTTTSNLMCFVNDCRNNWRNVTLKKTPGEVP